MVSDIEKTAQIELINLLTPDISGIHLFAEYIGEKAIPVAPIGNEDFENFFEIKRPDKFDGLYAYIAFDQKLTVKMGANYFKSLFNKFDVLKNLSGNMYGGQLDFLIVCGENRVLIFDAEDYSRRLDLTKEKLERKTGKYNDKFDLLRIENIVNKYVEDDFGEYTLHDFFSTLFRFSISDDKAFEIRTKKLRGELLTYITNHVEAQKIIIEEVVHESIEILNYEKSFHKEIISAVTDTLVLRQILVRILEGRYGFSEKQAKDIVKSLGLGSSLDESISKRKHVDIASEIEFQAMKNPKDAVAEQLELFNSIEIVDMTSESDKEIEQLRADFLNDYSRYGGDLYVGDVAEAATRIEMLLTANEWTKMWHWTSNENFDFDLADVSPSTIGEQYEQTMGNELKVVNGYLYYESSKKDQKNKGAFYTQEKITEYILEQTLGRKLNEIISDLENASKNKKNEIIKQFLSMKMADITSGGGSFLAGAVKLIGNKYDAIISAINDDKQVSKIFQLSSKAALQEHAIRFMIYGIDIDLKALIVSSFALSLETMIGDSNKLPQLLGKTLLHSNSLVSTVGYKDRKIFFESYKDEIKELRKIRISFLAGKVSVSEYESKRKSLQKNFTSQAVLKHKNLNEQLLENKLVEALEINMTEVFFDLDGNLTAGFDIIFGNPPYISLQKLKQEKEIYTVLGDFETIEARGDIYALFYERALQLLKQDGYLGFITSNKWMRAGYGEKLRNFFVDKNNPLLLIDLGGDMFNAKVDTNILIIQKSSNKDALKVIDLSKRAKEPKKRLENMSDFIKQNSTSIKYPLGESWVVLSTIEKSIKTKIESKGIPLKEWDVKINRGILTGLNNAFIITQKKRDELIFQDPNSSKIIFPILRGKNIKRYKIEFEDNYIINSHNGYISDTGKIVDPICIEDYPAIKKHLDSFFPTLSERTDQGNTPYNLRSLAYMDDFSKQKIVFSRISGDQPCFALDNDSMLTTDTGYIITGCNLDYLLEQLTSDFIWFAFKRFYMGGGIEKEFKLNNLLNLPIPLPNTPKPIFTDEEIKFIEHYLNN